ncbi:MAG TPA: hypothetical protein VM367_19000 [Pseudonocardia sp.]|jgi:hypothetical protein|nr:hypothetical protein [Pseudonocardia sp.]
MLLVEGIAEGSALVAVPVQNPPPPVQGEEFGKSSPVGLVVVLLLAVATVVLIRGMTKRIKRLPASFDEQPPSRADRARPSGPDADTRD